MSRQPRGGTGDVARGAGYAAFLGALLIGVAVIIGIVLLQIGDRNDNGPSSVKTVNSTTSKPKSHSTTSTTVRHGGTTTPTSALLPPSAVSLIVLNGGALSGQAGVMSSELRRQGYTNQQPANDWTGHRQVGNSVYCRAGLRGEGAKLAVLVGSNVKLIIPFSNPAPPFSASLKCVVVVGAAS